MSFNSLSSGHITYSDFGEGKILSHESRFVEYSFRILGILAGSIITPKMAGLKNKERI